MRVPARALPITAAVVAVLACAALIAGCGSSPAATAAAPSTEPGQEGPTPVVTPVPTPAGPEADVVVAAENIAFTPPDGPAPAGRSFTLAMVNRDAGVPHGIEIRDAEGRSVYRSELVTGPAAPVFEVPALEAGQYPFSCPVHPNMTGALTVGG